MRNTLHAFEQSGLACLKQASSRPKTIHAECDQQKCEALRAMLHQSPRTSGKDTRVWTLALAAHVCQELQVSKEDPDPKALRCSGMLDAHSGQIRLRFVDGRPISQVTTHLLEWLCQQVAAQGQGKLVLIWENACLP